MYVHKYIHNNVIHIIIYTLQWIFIRFMFVQTKTMRGIKTFNNKNLNYVHEPLF